MEAEAEKDTWMILRTIRPKPQSGQLGAFDHMAQDGKPGSKGLWIAITNSQWQAMIRSPHDQQCCLFLPGEGQYHTPMIPTLGRLRQED